MEVTQGVRYDTLGLSAPLMRAIEKKGYEVSTPVQAGAIPPMMAWKDVTAKAPTGTGKTYAFGIPILEHIDAQSENLQAVILAPTRELALQITDELRQLAAFMEGVKIVCCYGGQPIGKQIDALKRHPQIVVATPGRFSDHMKRRTLKVDAVQTVVLDEADRMLDMGFIHDVTRILDKIPHRRNLGLFSATISREVMDIAWVYQRDAEEITVQADEKNKPDIVQYRIDVDMDRKVETMARILHKEGYERVIVFCNTKGSVERMTKYLQMAGEDAECIHGDIPQAKREKVMQRFRDGKLRVFVATDVAARGIDVDDVDAVFNFDVPEENEYYVHRIGRTGRAKRHGTAYTFVSDYGAMVRLDEIAKFTKNVITPVEVAEDGTLTAVKKG
ncbi:MAG TPA: DEAD/DEAH box helicase [Firmicutes bacterium]|nr:DEAD/DEAH box helicase [Bacillota bacterium]